jgi:hypothetical protein
MIEHMDPRVGRRRDHELGRPHVIEARILFETGSATVKDRYRTPAVRLHLSQAAHGFAVARGGYQPLLRALRESQNLLRTG